MTSSDAETDSKPIIIIIIIKKCTKESNLQDIVSVVKRFRGALPLMHKLYVGALTIGISTAMCENSFSALARVLRPH